MEMNWNYTHVFSTCTSNVRCERSLLFISLVSLAMVLESRTFDLYDKGYGVYSVTYYGDVLVYIGNSARWLRFP